MRDRFYTFLLIPEKTSKVRSIVVPSWLIKSGLMTTLLAIALLVIMFLDYWFVLNQMGENNQIKSENRRLRQQVQIFRNKMATVEGTMDRIDTFSTRLKVITNFEESEN